MGRLPYLTIAPKETSRQIGNFIGLNKGTVINENEFSDMRNMSSIMFPAIMTRKPRGKILKELSKPHGLFYKNGLAYVDGTKMYYKDKEIATVSDTDKIIVGMGAYMVVFPDKFMYNTSNGEKKELESTWKQSTSATFAQTTAGSTMVKISCTGIGKQFSQFDGVKIDGCTNSSFNKSTTIQEIADDYIIIIGDLSAGFTQDSGLTITRTVPDMDYVCESENRLWGCSSEAHEIYASKLGDPCNWQAFEGISTDSYSVTVGSDGDFTGCLSHLGYVLFFKEDTIHKIFGNKPSNYQVTTSAPMRGIAEGCQKTACIVNETLMYVSRNGICSYDGAQPEAVAEALEPLGFVEGAAGQYDGKYYASLKDRNGKWGLYVYDMVKRIWDKEDDLHLLHMAYGAGELYCIDNNGALYTISGDREELIEWMLESGDMLDGTIEYKYLKRLLFNVQMQTGSELDIFLQYDDQEGWEKLNTYTARSSKTLTLTVIPRRCTKYRYRIEGKGPATLIAMGKYIGYGSEIHGNI